MRRLTFRKKLWIPLVVSLLALIASAAFSAYQAREIRIEERKKLLVAVSTAAMNLVKQYDDLAKRGVMSQAEAQRQASERLRDMRYGPDGYFSIFNSSNIIVMHPIKREMIGTDQSNMRDPAGTSVYIELNRAARQEGGGFAGYLWPHVGGKDAVPKTAFAARYAPWDWTISTGAYMDDIDEAFFASLYYSIGFLLLMVAALVTIVIWINRGLLAMLRGAQSAAEAISADAAQIARGNAELASRTAQQAGNLEETATAMEELTSTVRNNADNARQANALVTGAAQVAGQGGEVIGEAVETMRAISDASGKIADITTVIDGIAFQTNILALNAAVEAARAGEQGRGFAVVASEVRNLAQRSAAAAKEIKTLIDDSVAKIESGTRFVNRAGDTMSNIVGSIRRVADIMNEIANASQEQSQGIGQVNEAVAQMDQATQHNVAMVEEAAAAADGLQNQTANLSALIRSFWTGAAVTESGMPAIADESLGEVRGGMMRDVGAPGLPGRAQLRLRN